MAIDPLNIRNPKCSLCPLHSGATSICVSGEGPRRDILPVLILGEAPGREEDSLGRPFVGASGKLLRSTLKLEKLPYERFYITNTVKCFPNGTPAPGEVAICSKNYLSREIKLLNPHYILAVGGTAFSALVPSGKISKSRGKVFNSWVGDALVVPIWHPAYILRNRSKESEWKDDISKFRALLEVDLKI